MSAKKARASGPRVAFATDLHLREVERALHEPLLASLVAEIVAWGPDLILIGGDLTGWSVPHKATPVERNMLTRAVVELAERAPVVAVRGNHDFPGDHAHLGYLSNVTWVEDGPAWVELSTPRGDVGVIALPWLDRSRFAGRDWREALREHWHAVFGGFRAEAEAVRASGGRVFALAHAAVAGGVLRAGQPSLPTEDPVIDLGALPRIVDAGFLGHYHEPHEPEPGWWYGGAPFVNEFGESTRRGWLSLDGDGRVEHHELAQPARLRISLGDPLPVLASGDRVRLVVPVASPELLPAAKVEASRVAAAVEAAGATASVAYEVAHATRTREGAVEVAEAPSVREKLTRWAAAAGETLPPRAFELLDELVAEVEGAS